MRRVLVIALAAALAFVFGWLLMFTPAGREPPGGVTLIDVSRLHPPRPALELDSVEAQARTAVRTEEAASVPAATAETRPGEALHIEFEVVDEDSQQPRADLDVMGSFHSPGRDFTPLEKRRTNEQGIVAYTVADDAHLVSVNVRYPQSNASLAEWAGAPGRRTRIEVPAALFVYGQVLLQGAEVGREPERLSVNVSSSRTLDGVGKYLGRGPLGAENRFMIPIFPARVEARIRFHLYHEQQFLAEREADLMIARVPPGVEIEVRAHLLEVRLREHDGGPAAQGSVGIEWARPGDTQPRATSKATDPSGAASFLVPADRVRLCAWSPGHRARVLDLGLPSGPIEIALERLDPQDVFRVRVVAARDEPIEAAIVTVRPTDSMDLGQAAMVQGRTGPDGEVALPCVPPEEAFLVVYHKNHGDAGHVLIHPRRGHTFIVRMEDVADLTIELSIPEALQSMQRGRLSWCAIDVERSRSWSSTFSVVPYVIRHLPRGECLVFVCHRDSGLHGLARVRLGTQPRQTVTIELVEGQTVAGRVVLSRPSESAGLRVRLDLPELSSEIERRYCSAPVREDGSFEVFAGARGAGLLTLERHGQTLWEGQVSSAAAVLLSVPGR